MKTETSGAPATKLSLTSTFSPFWALERTSTSRDVNMKLDQYVFAVPRLTPAVKMPTPAKKSLYSFVCQGAVNTKKIKKDDLLYLSLMEDCLESSDEEED